MALVYVYVIQFSFIYIATVTSRYLILSGKDPTLGKSEKEKLHFERKKPLPEQGPGRGCHDLVGVRETGQKSHTHCGGDAEINNNE